MKKNINKITILIFLFILISCNKNIEGTWNIADVSKDTLLSVKTNGKIIAIDLHIIGNVNDTCQVHYSKLAGKNIDYKISPEVYGENVKIQFKSLKATEGNLKINYHIKQY